MTQEEKQLLLKDLCARLPYGVKIGLIGAHKNLIGGPVVLDIEDYKNSNPLIIINSNWLPYLRPLSSMTKEEGKELEHIFSEIDAPCWVDTEYGCVTFAGGDFIDAGIAEVYTDWLNKKMFDYRGLIEKGLALEAPEDMYKNE